MVETIRVRDVVRGELFELGPEEPALRASYNLFSPTGPVVLHDGLAEWLEGDRIRTSRVVSAALGDVNVGERVLVRVGSDEDEWWLCDVEALDGVAHGQ